MRYAPARDFQMKSLTTARDKKEIIIRLGQLKPDSQRLWGKMTPHQMICHLTDSFKLAIGEKSVSSVDVPVPRVLIKWIALKTPIRWPKGVKTRPEMDQERGGTKPSEFEADFQQLEGIIERFVKEQKDHLSQAHPLFAKMSEEEWMRWGYLHLDHHLRQFGL